MCSLISSITVYLVIKKHQSIIEEADSKTGTVPIPETCADYTWRDTRNRTETEKIVTRLWSGNLTKETPGELKYLPYPQSEIVNDIGLATHKVSVPISTPSDKGFRIPLTDELA